MRRGIQMWQTQDGFLHADMQPNSVLQFIEVPRRAILIDRFNTLQNTTVPTFAMTDPGASFPGFDGSGNPVQLPGTVIPPGDPIVTGFFGGLTYAGFLFDFQQDYNSKTNGDGAGAIINADGSRSRTDSKQDLSGAQTLVELFLQLMNSLIKSYSSKGDKRTVGILKDLLNRFLSGVESITDILDELRKLFII